MDIKEFKELLEKHDWTYKYSDDSRVYNAGVQSWENISLAMEAHPELKPIYEEYKKR